ncbi:MAG: asparagine--tRNA ligase [Candidatus Bathyarchaeum sp.]|nr:MAG: asparagine--tRNA ligase [Candidatus Bathyarchaeum sp.]
MKVKDVVISFTSIRRVLNGDFDGKQVNVRGWVYRKRTGKKVVFVVLRDATGIIQCTVKRDSLSWDEAQKVSIESSVTVSGTVRSDGRAPGGFEISINELKIVGLAEAFPITKDQSEEFRRDVRHLWLRSQKMNAIMKIRSKVLKLVHEFFRKKTFIEVSPPMFISSAVEGGATLFGVKYFDRDLYLTQSAQLHLEVLIASLEKVYCIAPSFRAEKSRTIRHLAEYWHIEAEQAFATMEDLMRLEEDLVSHICQEVAKDCKNELETLNVDTKRLAEVQPPFPRITYDQAIEKLSKMGYKVKWGMDFGFEDEKALAKEFGKPFFVYAYPKESKAFYCKMYEENPKLVMSVDMIVPNIGELATGGSRIDDKEKLIVRLKEFGLKEEDYDWYIDQRRYGTTPHGGFGMGVERLLAWMLNLETVMETIPFPRTTRRYYP